MWHSKLLNIPSFKFSATSLSPSLTLDIILNTLIICFLPLGEQYSQPRTFSVETRVDCYSSLLWCQLVNSGTIYLIYQ